MQNLFSSLIQKMSQDPKSTPDWLIVMFTVQILSYSGENVVKNMDIGAVFHSLCDRLNDQISKMSSWKNNKIKAESFVQPK